MGKRANGRDSAPNIFDFLLSRFGPGVPGDDEVARRLPCADEGHHAMKFEKYRQRDDESVDKFFG